MAEPSPIERHVRRAAWRLRCRAPAAPASARRSAMVTLKVARNAGVTSHSISTPCSTTRAAATQASTPGRTQELPRQQAEQRHEAQDRGRVLRGLADPGRAMLVPDDLLRQVRRPDHEVLREGQKAPGSEQHGQDGAEVLGRGAVSAVEGRTTARRGHRDRERNRDAGLGRDQQKTEGRGVEGRLDRLRPIVRRERCHDEVQREPGPGQERPPAPGGKATPRDARTRRPARSRPPGTRRRGQGRTARSSTIPADRRRQPRGRGTSLSLRAGPEWPARPRAA